MSYLVRKKLTISSSHIFIVASLMWTIHCSKGVHGRQQCKDYGRPFRALGGPMTFKKFNFQVFAPVDDVFTYNPDIRALDQKETLSHIGRWAPMFLQANR